MVGMVVIVVVVVVVVVIVRTSAKYQPKLTPSPLARICPTLPPSSLWTSAPGLGGYRAHPAWYCVHVAYFMRRPSASATLVLCHGRGGESHLTHLQSQR